MLKTITLAALMLSFTAFSQIHDISIEASQNITTFLFLDSTDVKDKGYSPAYSGGYALGYRYKFDFGMYVGGKLGMRQGGASYVYNDQNYKWRLNYMEVRAIIGYSYPFGKFGAHMNLQPYFGYLIGANQRMGDEDIDLIKYGGMKRADFGMFISPGANFQANDLINIYIDLNYMLGFSNLETVDNQKSRNRLFGATLGAAFTIK